MSFKKANRAYEAWLRKQCAVVDAELAHKHERMAESAFVFLRATFFRWAQQIEEVCPDLAGAPAVLSVGDAHLENFGTWRDAEGRLVWGINDFDEAASIPYPYDLVRLTASARLAPKLPMAKRDIATAILDGYRFGLAEPRPTLLDEQETWMRPLVACSDKDRVKFWTEIDDYPDAKPPKPVVDGLRQALPVDATVLRFASRAKGGGSLGRPRYVAVAAWRGGRIVREAKALVPSGWDWAHAESYGRSHALELAGGKHRSADPFLYARSGYIFRRIAADSRKIDYDDHPSFSVMLLTAMGFELGSIHAADKRRAQLRDDLESRGDDWLHDAAKVAANAVETDYDEWIG
jgi:hypothetical protein